MKESSIKGKPKSREEILIYIYQNLAKPLFKEQNFEIAENVKISIGIPKGKKAIGECWNETCGNDYFHIFLSPSIVDLVKLTDVLIHQAIHTKIFNHRRGFIKAAKSVGLVEPWTATNASEELKEKIINFIKGHKIEWIEPILTPVQNKKKQTTRMIKLECENPQCGYIIRTSKTNIVEKGVPTCACGENFKYDESDIEEEEGEE